MPRYSITVSQNGKHLFTTARRHMTLSEAHDLYDELRHAFPTAHRFNVEASEWEEVGRDVTGAFEEETG